MLRPERGFYTFVYTADWDWLVRGGSDRWSEERVSAGSPTKSGIRRALPGSRPEFLDVLEKAFLPTGSANASISTPPLGASLAGRRTNVRPGRDQGPRRLVRGRFPERSAPPEATGCWQGRAACGNMAGVAAMPGDELDRHPFAGAPAAAMSMRPAPLRERVRKANSLRPVWLVTSLVGGVGIALAGPEWVPLDWSREDGPIEYAGFACFLVASMLAFVIAWQVRRTRRSAFAAAALAAVLLFAAGEEISWGQRLFDLETPEVLVDGNRQDELNLHNLDGLQQKAVLGQLAIAGAGVLLAWYVRRPWAWSGLPFFAGYLLYRGSRGVAAAAGWAPAGRNSEAAELMLALGLLVLTTHLAMTLRRRRLADETALVG
jgi:hypothetical protein